MVQVVFQKYTKLPFASFPPDYTENVQFVLLSPEVIKEGDDVQFHCEGDGHPPSDTVFYKVEVVPDSSWNGELNA